GAVFLETWMDGGLGRAQGGYDEMVFRAMVRDDAHFYDPLGLVSRGVQVDFQVVSNAYLYGTRFVTYLAYTYSPDKVVAWFRRDGTEKRLADIKRAMLYRVASFAYDPASGTAFYTNDNLALRDLMAVDVRTGAVTMLLEDARIGDIAFNPVDRSLMGVRHMNGLATLVRIPFPYNEWTAIHTFPYEAVPYDLDISPDGRLLSASMSEVSTDQFVRVWQIDKL